MINQAPVLNHQAIGPQVFSQVFSKNTHSLLTIFHFHFFIFISVFFQNYYYHIHLILPFLQYILITISTSHSLPFSDQFFTYQYNMHLLST